MDTQTEKNKEVVKRYNREVIEQENVTSAKELLDGKFVNHSAPEGQNRTDALIYFFNQMLRPGVPDLKVVIELQVAESDMVTTHKRIYGTQTGTLIGVPATGKAVNIEIIDMMKVQNGKITEHWGVNTLPAVMAELAKP